MDSVQTMEVNIRGRMPKLLVGAAGAEAGMRVVMEGFIIEPLIPKRYWRAGPEYWTSRPRTAMVAAMNSPTPDNGQRSAASFKGAAPLGPLNGIRVIDLTTVIMGPFASRILGDMGADLVKVEEPGGDMFRQYGPLHSKGMGGSILNLHRNKRSVALDLKQPGHRAALVRLIAGADVVLHNLRPAPVARLKLDWPSVRAINPRVILCAARGFSQEGPYGDKAAYDDLIQAGSGIASLFSRQGGAARYVPTAICDKIVGQAAVYAVLGALLARERGGSGQEVEVPMFETMIDFVLTEHLAAGAFEPPLGPMGFPRQLSPQRKPYQTRDGWACILPYTDRNWVDFFAFIGRPEVMADPRFASVDQRVKNIDALYTLLEQEALLRTSQEWMEFCDRVSIPCMPVLTLEQVLEDEHVRAIGFVQSDTHPTEGRYRALQSPVRFGNTPYALGRHAPRIGEHTAEVLAEAGLSAEQIAAITASAKP